MWVLYTRHGLEWIAFTIPEPWIFVGGMRPNASLMMIPGTYEEMERDYG